MNEMSKSMTIPEILTYANNQPSKVHRLNAIRQNNSEALELILQYALAEHIRFDLPHGDVPFKRDENIPIGMTHTNLHVESRRLYIFLEGQAQNVPKARKEMLFIQMLEGLHPLDADIVIMIKNKTFEQRYPNLTYELIYETIPNLLPHPNTRKKATKLASVVEAPVEKEQVIIHEENLEPQQKKINTANNSRFRTDENGNRIRIMKNGEDWPKPGEKKQ